MYVKLHEIADARSDLQIVPSHFSVDSVDGMPYNSGTHFNMLGARQFASMQPGSVVILASRAALVHRSGPSAAGAALSAGTQSANTGTIIFADGGASTQLL